MKILQKQIKTMKTNTKTKQINNCKHNKNKHNHVANHTTYETNTKIIKTIKPNAKRYKPLGTRKTNKTETKAMEQMKT